MGFLGVFFEMSGYDVVVVGGGIGGTAIGGILAFNGLKTLLVEKNGVVGGRCTSYEREGFKVDVGVHTFGRSGKGPLGAVLRMMHMEDAVEWVLARNPGPAQFYGGKFWKFPRELEKLVPESDYRELIRLLGELMRIEDTHKLDGVSLKSWLSQYTAVSYTHLTLPTNREV